MGKRARIYAYTEATELPCQIEDVVLSDVWRAELIDENGKTSAIAYIALIDSAYRNNKLISNDIELVVIDENCETYIRDDLDDVEFILTEEDDDIVDVEFEDVKNNITVMNVDDSLPF